MDKDIPDKKCPRSVTYNEIKRIVLTVAVLFGTQA